MSHMPFAVIGALAVLLALAVGCGSSASQASDDLASPQSLSVPQSYGGQYIGVSATGDTQAGAQFARWVAEQDPQHQYYSDVVVRNEQVLGAKVAPNVTRADVQRLLVSLTEGMARTFPGKPLKTIAFYQSGDKLAEASYDPGRGQVQVQFAR